MEEADIWRAAKQLTDLYPDDPVLAAAQRADKALEIGDMFNFNLWSRVTKAVQALEQFRPTRGQAIN